MSLFFQDVFYNLEKYCESESFKGWDPYDGLNSKVFISLPFKNSRIMRLIWIQLFKRSPINLRRIFLVPKEYNAKGLGLFLASECKNYSRTKSDKYNKRINLFVEELKKLRSNGYSGSCWGYNFDWQARVFFQPKETPTVVATSFIANAFLDVYDLFHEQEMLEEARSACNFILRDLNRTYDDDGTFCFSYSPLDKSQVYNASLLGSKLLARVYSYTREEELIDVACKSVEYCVKAQQSNGAWSYGTLPFHKWIDNFHTGYNLECLSDYELFSGDKRFRKHLEAGFNYYKNTFFTNEGIPKYYNNNIYPVDIHATAQLVLTVSKLGVYEENKDLVEKVLKWTIENMLDDKGYFYYQKKNTFTSKISYMRWAQAWMYYALSVYLYDINIK
ncbi:MAG: hypothetical protein JW717_05400 [Marinilabiliaceae bacterium]|nr:hypothetical protein [Marinilabiliaceae bacterium]